MSIISQMMFACGGLQITSNGRGQVDGFKLTLGVAKYTGSCTVPTRGSF